MAVKRFSYYAWGLLAYNLVVILGGAYVRASISGDGCGDHWPTCMGSLIPHPGRIQTLIEFSHRASTGLLLPLILILWYGAFRYFPKRHPARKGATYAFLLTMAEALIGAGLVLFKLVAHDQSVYRAVVMPTHLVTTFLLLMSLTLTAWWSSGGSAPKLRDQGAMTWLMGAGLLAAIILGISGAVTALGDTLYPAKSLAEGLKQDFSPSAHFLVSLRIYHPLIAISSGLYLLLISGLAIRLRPSLQVRCYAGLTGTIFLTQMAAGLLNLLMLAPIAMQLIHLLLADLLWISLVLMTASALSENVPHVEMGEAELDAIPGLEALANGPVSWKDYVALTKPRVISLLLFTTVTAMFIAAGSDHRPLPSLWVFLAVSIGFYMAAGASNAINMVLERDLDVRMARTSKRPTVTHKISPGDALKFAFAMMIGSFLLLWWSANLLSASMALAGLSCYVIVYTIWLKRRSWSNIVIGGAAGAFPPLVGWAAVTGNLSLMAWCLFGIIFLWTPVHFWALAILIKEDYAKAGVPMLPVVRGVKATVVQIVFYAILTLLVSTAPLYLIHQANGRAMAGWFYMGAAVALNAALLWRCAQLYRRPDRLRAKSLFTFSMLYLALIFLALAVDKAHWI